MTKSHRNWSATKTRSIMTLGLSEWTQSLNKITTKISMPSLWLLIKKINSLKIKKVEILCLSNKKKQLLKMNTSNNSRKINKKHNLQRRTRLRRFQSTHIFRTIIRIFRMMHRRKSFTKRTAIKISKIKKRRKRNCKNLNQQHIKQTRVQATEV